MYMTLDLLEVFCSFSPLGIVIFADLHPSICLTILCRGALLNAYILIGSHFAFDMSSIIMIFDSRLYCDDLVSPPESS